MALLSYAYATNMYLLTLLDVTGNVPVWSVYTFPLSSINANVYCVSVHYQPLGLGLSQSTPLPGRASLSSACSCDLDRGVLLPMLLILGGIFIYYLQ